MITGSGFQKQKPHKLLWTTLWFDEKVLGWSGAVVTFCQKVTLQNVRNPTFWQKVRIAPDQDSTYISFGPCLSGVKLVTTRKTGSKRYISTVLIRCYIHSCHNSTTVCNCKVRIYFHFSKHVICSLLCNLNCF